MSKICSGCGKTVDDSVKFCPYCKGQSFRPAGQITKPDNSIVHKLFYWNYDGYYMISRAKTASIFVFLLFSVVALISGAPVGMLVVAVILSLLVYVLGFGIRHLIKKPSKAKITHNDYGLAKDLIHMFFFWQNNEGEFVLSKTKIGSHIVFLIFFAISFAINDIMLFSHIIFAIFFEIPAFLVGYGVHKLTNPNPQPKVREVKEVKKPEITPQPQPQIPINRNKIIPEYLDCQLKLDELNSKFRDKEKSARNLIEKRFEPPQLTYTRFITGVDKSSQLFNKNLESAHTMINLADEYSPRIAEEVETKIGILKEIIQKMDDLSNELVVSNDLSKKEDVDNLISDMDDLIKSVRQYDE